MSTDSLSLLSKLKNKALYQVEKLVNDPEANAFVQEKEQEKGKKQDEGGKQAPAPVKEAMTQEEEAEEVTSDSPVIRVLQKMLYYTKYALRIAFFPIIALLLSSFIANEMIIYPAPIRLIFFLFTLVLCILSRVILIFLGSFYLFKSGYHYYVNNMSDGPKRLIMPSLFAFLPLTTREYENSLINLLVRPFQYGEKWSSADGKELEKRMENYQDTLKAAFPYLEAIQTTDPFREQLQKIQTRFSELHKAMAPPSATTTATVAVPEGAPKESSPPPQPSPPLPATV